MCVCVCVCSHPEAVVPAAVCDLLAGDLPGVVLSEVPVEVVGVHVGLSGGEPHAAQTALVPRVQLRHHALVTPGRRGAGHSESQAHKTELGRRLTEWTSTFNQTFHQVGAFKGLTDEFDL